MVIRRRLALALATALATTAPFAHADRAALREARRVVEEEVRYDRAQELLVAALHAGDNGPDELAGIYELAGIAAVVLGQHEAGEQYFRRLLALRPQARLPADTAPKLVEPFAAAQAHMAALGSLRASVHVAAGGALVVEVAADPLGMVAGALVRYRDGAGQVASARGVAPPPIALNVPAGAAALSVAVLDEYGNRLLELASPAVTDGPAPTTTSAARPLLRRWPTWAAAAGVAGAVSIGFALDGRRAHDRLDRILAEPSMYYFDEAEDARRRWQRDITIANVALVTAGLFAAGAVTMAILGRGPTPSQVAVSPWLGAGAGGLVIAGPLP